MKNIKERAIEAERNTHPLFETIRESDGKPVSVYDQDNMISMFEQGANYVIGEIEKLTNNQNWCAFPKQSHKELKELIEQLKK